MKKFWMLTAAAIFAVMLTGCGDSYVDAVKGGVLEDIDNTRTVEQMLSAKYKKLKWHSFTSDTNQRVVEVTGVRAFTDKEKAEYEQMRRKLLDIKENGVKDNPFGELAKIQAIQALTVLPLMPQDGDRITIQFILSADGESFDVGYCELRDRNGELKKFGQGDTVLTSTTESAYKDGYEFIKACVK